jgi:maltose/moltooligosaccharide transporter
MPDSPHPTRAWLRGPVLAVGFGALAIAAVWSLYSVFMPLLLRDFVASRALRGAIMGLDNLSALLLIPLVGAWSDRAHGPLGKRLPFLLVLMPVAAIAFFAIPLARGSLWALLGAALVFLLAMTSSRAPLTASMPDHVAPDDRSSANGVITLLGAVGTAVALMGLGPLFERASWAPFALAALLVLISVPLLWFTLDRDPPYVGEHDPADQVPAARAVLRDVSALLRARPRGPLLLLLTVFFGFVGFSALEAQFSTLATETLGASEGQSGVLLGVASLAFVAVAIPVGAWARRVGEVAVMRWGAVALAIVSLVAARVHEPAVLAPVLAAAGVAWAMVVVPAYPLVVNQGGADRVGFYTGMYYFAGSAAAIVAPSVVGAAMDAFGNAALFYAIATSMALGLGALVLAQRVGLASRADAGT